MFWTMTLKNNIILAGALSVLCLMTGLSVWAQHPVNSQEYPEKILHTGTKLSTGSLSPNAMQLAEQLELLPLFSQIRSMQSKAALMDEGGPDSLLLRVKLLELKDKAHNIIQKTSMEVDYFLSGIAEEKYVNDELLTAFLDKNDKTITRANALGFGINGLLWPVSAAFNIASHNQISGIIGIPAGVVPILTSGYALMKVNGGRYSAPADPNVLAELFNSPITSEVEYPKSIWTFLHTVPVDDPECRTRLDQIIEHWIIDKNIPKFTGKNSREIAIISGTIPQKRTLTLDILTHREIMFEQLAAEVSKMDRLLLELMLVLTNEKQLPLESAP